MSFASGGWEGPAKQWVLYWEGEDGHGLTKGEGEKKDEEGSSTYFNDMLVDGAKEKVGWPGTQRREARSSSLRSKKVPMQRRECRAGGVWCRPDGDTWASRLVLEEWIKVGQG